MLKWRLLWGEKLENKMETADIDGAAKLQVVLDKWNELAGKGIPFILLLHREGKGWSERDSGADGAQLYMDSIMKDAEQS